jgi:hypothetical protein
MDGFVKVAGRQSSLKSDGTVQPLVETEPQRVSRVLSTMENPGTSAPL